MNKLKAIIAGVLVGVLFVIPVSAEDSEIKSEGVLTYEEYAKAETDTLVTIEAYVQAKQKWYEDNKELGTSTATIYAEDMDGGYFLYSIPCGEEEYKSLTEGTKFRYTGYKSEWAGEIEIVPDDLTPPEILDGNYIADPIDVTDHMKDKDELLQYQNRKVSFSGMTIVPFEETMSAFAYGWDGSGSEGDDLYFCASIDGSTCTFVVESYLCDADSEVYQAVKELEIGDKIDMEGFLYWYEGPQPHITNVVITGSGKNDKTVRTEKNSNEENGGQEKTKEQKESSSTIGSSNKTSDSKTSTTSFTNKYGTPTTKCAHSGCNNYIASSGDTNCCTIHSNKCLKCGKYIDEDAMYCMDCLKKSTSKSNSDYSSNLGSDTGGYGYNANDPYYSSNDHDGDGKINDDEFHDAMNDAIDDMLKEIGY